jgi:hypothetical protein
VARVEIYQGGNVRPASTTDARLRAADFSASPLGAGLRATGQAVSEFIDAKQQADEIQDRASVKEAVNALGQHYSEVGYTGSNPYYEKAGKDALTLRPEVEKGLDEFIQTSRAGLANDRQRKIYDEAVTPQRTAWGIQIANHAQKEARQYDIDESQARVGVSGELARGTYIADPHHAEEQIASGLDEIDNLARLNSWGPDRIAVEKLKFTSSTYRDIGAAIITADPTNGPTVAAALVEQQKGAMTADDREFVLNNAQQQVRMNEAEKRREEAELRRIEREQKSDAKDRANSVYRNIQDGVPVDSATLAGAIADAKQADDPALAEGLRQGGLKNALTRQYAGASPVELQERVNTLSAEIVREGAKVSPDKIVERDHLQTLLGRANTAVATDPLSYGASAMGIDIGRLDLNNSQSIQERSRVAGMVSKRTGGAIKVMTNEEAATFAPIVNGDNVQQKARLAVGLARFGGLADEASRQIAPNNDGFANLVGLAGHTNHAVGISRVTQVLAGQTILKSTPKMIDRDAAMRMFDAQTGLAFTFLPSVRKGVLDNAFALLAYDANERGEKEWGGAIGDKGSRWYAAFNSALGAYTRDGKQYGGLAKLNGGVTIVPEEMAVPDFEARISRARGQQFRNAQNGLPELANGTVPTADMLRKLQWIPVRDGVYRLSNGAAYMMKKGGGFYEVDIRKLK